MRLQILAPVLLLPTLAAAQPQEPVPEIVVTTQASGPPTSAVLPTKGMNKAAVTAQYGAPQTRRAAVGGGSRQQPPITRWDYPGYSVIFENDHVIDTVVQDQPAPIAVYDGLAGGPQ